MKIIRTGLSPACRLAAGAQILAAAETTDTTLVDQRMMTFARMHRAYALTYEVMAAVEVQIDGRQAIVAQRVAALDAAVEKVAGALAANGHSRRQPFAAFGVDPPSAIKKLKAGEKAKAVHRLVGVMEGHPKLNAATGRAAAAADEAARRLEKALQQLEKLQTSRQRVRAARQAAAKNWDNALAALKLDARAAAREGAPGLHTALFGRSRRKCKAAAKSGNTPLAATPETKAPVITPDTTAPAVKSVGTSNREEHRVCETIKTESLIRSPRVALAGALGAVGREETEASCINGAGALLHFTDKDVSSRAFTRGVTPIRRSGMTTWAHSQLPWPDLRRLHTQPHGLRTENTAKSYFRKKGQDFSQRHHASRHDSSS